MSDHDSVNAPHFERASEGLPLLFVGPSHIHGQGLFAGEDIRAGTVVGWCEVVPAETPGPHTLWCDSGPVDVVCDLRFTNHSAAPNVVYYDSLRVVALHDIGSGEELTYNYGPDFQPEGS